MEHELIIYIIRWQLSSLILAPVIHYGNKRRWPSWLSATVANFIGSLVFFPFDKFVTFGG
jgi:membrane protein YqaA with SNARE-associated domain